MFLFLAQVSIATCAIAMSLWAKTPWIGILALVVASTGDIAARLIPAAWLNRFFRSIVILAWVTTLVIPGRLVFLDAVQGTPELVWASLFAGFSWFVALPFLPLSSPNFPCQPRPIWKLAALVAAFLADLLWLAAAYSENERAAFFAGVLAALLLLQLCKAWFHPPWLPTQIINTLLLLLIGLPLANWAFELPSIWAAPPESRPEVLLNYSSYQAAKSNPAGFESWWAYYSSQRIAADHVLFEADPRFVFARRPRPNSHAKMVLSEISINSKGFRGKEFPEEKGGAFRIVALGESTTFGITVGADDPPWPELLEKLIKERLKPLRPVEVINAGIPGIPLPDNVIRLRDDILPLKPDMLISYHGINGFPLLGLGSLSMWASPPPEPRLRPLSLLGACEYRFKLWRYRKSRTPATVHSSASLAQLLSTPYARAYKDLIELCTTNRLRLVLANYSMAVNDSSDAELINFFSRTAPSAPADIWSNIAHSLILEALAQRHPEVLLVDTHPHLDACPEKFLDLVHFNQAGEKQLAETMFDAIRPTLEKQLSSNAPNPSNQPSSQSLSNSASLFH
jgi:lysophospholipase L1-like esterase